MLKFIAQLGSILGSPVLYVIIIALGLIFSPKKSLFGRLTLIVSFTMIYNMGLKSLWQVPLPPPLEGWAFPSGHMHSAIIFWGCLAIEIHRTWFSEIVFLILCFVAYGLLYHGYHWPVDILGSVTFGSLSLGLFWTLNKLFYFHSRPYRAGYVLSALAIGIFIFLPSFFIQKPITWIVLGILCTTTLGWTIMANYQRRLKKF